MSKLNPHLTMEYRVYQVQASEVATHLLFCHKWWLVPLLKTKKERKMGIESKAAEVVWMLVCNYVMLRTRGSRNVGECVCLCGVRSHNVQNQKYWFHFQELFYLSDQTRSSAVVLGVTALLHFSSVSTVHSRRDQKGKSSLVFFLEKLFP